MKNIVIRSEKNYVIEKYLGGGSFGAVWLAHLQNDPSEKYAIKIIPYNLETNVENEIHIMLKLSSSGRCIDRIVCIYDFIKDEENKNTYIVMEYVDGKKLTEINEYIVMECLMALCYMHYENILHRDIKPDNIMVDKDGNIKLVDLGLGCTISEDEMDEEIQSCSQNMPVGTLAYLDPLFFQKEINKSCKSSDIYALGLSFYTILTKGQPPLYNFGMKKKDIRKSYDTVVENLNASDCSDKIKYLIMKMMDPCGNRPSCVDCINFLNGDDELFVETDECSDDRCVV
jgi:serine/threonine protein kinase